MKQPARQAGSPPAISNAQLRALHFVAKRDWPAGEPRLGWLHKTTGAALLRLGLITARPGSEDGRYQQTPVVDLTDAGRARIPALKGRAGQRQPKLKPAPPPG